VGNRRVSQCGKERSPRDGRDHAKDALAIGARTRATPFSQEMAPFQKLHPAITTHSLFGTSGDIVKRASELQQPCDVLGSADYSLRPRHP